MIGEIRDLDSATIAIQAAMTGHLVLSTLHTKSASETIERLMNMGIPNYILASGLDVILAQRLVRRLCPHCSVAHDADPSQIDIIKWMMKDI
jgi:type II secretory ATPase GspE/PulE/Tfp pilus assembly ATPase PilB-like protein